MNNIRRIYTGLEQLDFYIWVKYPFEVHSTNDAGRVICQNVMQITRLKMEQQ